MTDYRAIMTLLIKQRSYRQIEQQLGCSHRVIARANHTLRTCGFSTVEQVAALTDNELDELFVDKRSTGQGEFVPIDFEKSSRTGRTKQTLQVLWARYTTTPAGRGSGTTATTGSANLSQHMSTRPGFQHASHTHQDTPCKSTGQAPRCDCLTQRETGCKSQYLCRLSSIFRDAVCLCVC
ncbi:transposase [Corynebacterium striatum]|nr:transposase [Corynebacterium striatum]